MQAECRAPFPNPVRPEVPLIRFVLAMLIALALSACSSSQAYWYKADVSEFDTANHESECKFQTGLAKIKGDQAEELVRHCMQAKGFRLN